MKLSSLIATISAASTALAAPTATNDGIGIEVTHKVDCVRKTRDNDVISMTYALSLLDGTKIESTAPGETFTFTLGAGDVIAAWDMGLKDMCPGEKRKLTIPPEYGYGLDTVGPIPGNSTLVFDTMLVTIKGVPKETPRLPSPTPKA